MKEIDTDYKELINKLRRLSLYVPEQMCDEDGRDALERAATAIETLPAERYAAVEELRGQCAHCKHTHVCAFDKQYMFWCVGTNKGDWEWSGPQKGEPND